MFNPSCIDFIEKAFPLLLEFVVEMKKFAFFTDHDHLLSVVIIMLKSNISFRGVSDIEVARDSDNCMNYCFDSFFKYCLIRNISILERKVRQAFLIFFLDFEQK
jgi:hypothetical protein